MSQDIYVVAMEGFSETRTLADLPEKYRRNAIRAVNYAAARARTRSAKEIRQQVAYPASYLRGQDSRLSLRTSKSFDDEATITGQFRPTSLARFARRGGPGQDVQNGDRGVSVQMQPGSSGFVKRGFIMRLNAGAGKTDTKFNLGLAIRLKPGETIKGKHTMVQISSGLYLLYGASVNQVFRSVAADQVGDVQTDLQREFERLMGAGV